jgi:hypothetical protein
MDAIVCWAALRSEQTNLLPILYNVFPSKQFHYTTIRSASIPQRFLVLCGVRMEWQLFAITSILFFLSLFLFLFLLLEEEFPQQAKIGTLVEEIASVVFLKQTF